MEDKTSSRYALFEGPLLCVRVVPKLGWNDNWWGEPDPPYWEVINGAWYLKPPYEYTGGVLPKLLWEGNELPAPGHGYNENIYLIKQLVKSENADGAGI